MGPTLQWNGLLVCDQHYDKPQPQLRPIILPPDPVPVVLPRIEPFFNDMGLQGFTQYVLFLPPFAIQSQDSVLTAFVQASQTPPASQITSRAGTVGRQDVSQQIMGPNRRRNYLAIYNPADPQLQISLSPTAVWGAETNLILGPGEGLIWQGDGVYTGAVSAIGLIPNVPFYAWEAPVSGAFIVIPFNGPGNLAVQSEDAPALYSIALTPSSYNLNVTLPFFDGISEGPWGVKDSLGIAPDFPINIYPATGQQIDGFGINQPYPLNFSYQTVWFLYDKDLQRWLVS